ncbi:MAG: hypothetical protein ABL951_02475 [Alphaproteobacteria bacterium]
MSIINDYKEILAEIAREWDKADKDIKFAEQVCQKITISSIFELRYAGRRIIDALNMIAADADLKDVTLLLQEAKFDCHRARHDAIDAATSKIALDIDNMGRKLGYNAILKAYPGFAAFRYLLSGIRKKIAASRGNRQNREAIYASIEEDGFKGLVDEFDKIQEAEKIMKSLAKRERVIFLGGIAGIVIGAIGIAVTIFIAIVD